MSYSTALRGLGAATTAAGAARPLGKGLYYHVPDATAREPAVFAALVRSLSLSHVAIPLGAFAVLRATADRIGVVPWAFLTVAQSMPGVIADNARAAAALTSNVWLDPENGHSPTTMRTTVVPLVRELLTTGRNVVVTTNTGQIRGLVSALASGGLLNHPRLTVRLQAYDHDLGAPISYAAGQLALLTSLGVPRDAAGIDIGVLSHNLPRWRAYLAALPSSIAGGATIWSAGALNANEQAEIRQWSLSAGTLSGSAPWLVGGAVVLAGATFAYYAYRRRRRLAA